MNKIDKILLWIKKLLPLIVVLLLFVLTVIWCIEIVRWLFYNRPTKDMMLFTVIVLCIYLLIGLGLVVHRIYWHHSGHHSTHSKTTEMMKLCISVAVAFICCGAAVAFGSQIYQSIEMNNKLAKIEDMDNQIDDLYYGSLSTLAEVFYEQDNHKVDAFPREMQSIYHGLNSFGASYLLYDTPDKLEKYLDAISVANYEKTGSRDILKLIDNHEKFSSKYYELIKHHKYSYILENQTKIDSTMKKYKQRLTEIRDSIELGLH